MEIRESKLQMSLGRSLDDVRNYWPFGDNDPVRLSAKLDWDGNPAGRSN